MYDAPVRKQYPRQNHQSHREQLVIGAYAIANCFERII